jgi:predicted nucleic acid-binding Zn ribbon protein
MQKFTDKPLTRCPECRKGSVRRLLQPPAIVFKGSGWYATDHRSASGGGKKAESGETSSLDSGEKSESKPAKAKKEPKPAKADD